MIARLLLPLALALTSASDPPAPDGARLAAEDQAAYRAALADPEDAPAAPAAFIDLWAAPAAFQGKRVAVEGRVVRRFAQPAAGVYPALTEVWLVTADQNVLCLVHPTPAAAAAGAGGVDAGAIGSLVRFRGRLLRRIRYEGGDGARLAPCLIGPAPPQPVSVTPREPIAVGAVPWTYWAATLAALAALGLGAAWLQLGRRRATRTRGGTPATPAAAPLTSGAGAEASP